MNGKLLLVLLICLVLRVEAEPLFGEGDVAIGVASLPVSEQRNGDAGAIDESGYAELFREYRLGVGYRLTDWLALTLLLNLQEEIDGSDDNEEDDGLYSREDLDGYDAVGISSILTVRVPMAMVAPYASLGSQCSMVWIRDRSSAIWTQSDCASRIAAGLEFSARDVREGGRARLEFARGAIGPLRYYTLGIGLTGFF